MTLLTSYEFTDTQKQSKADLDKKFEVADTLLDIYVRGYHEGQVGLERLCKVAFNIVKAIDLPEQGRRTRLGEMLISAMAQEPKPIIKGSGRKGEPILLRNAVRDLVIMARKKEGISMTASSQGGDGAFALVSKWMISYGIESASERNVKEWYNPQK